MLNYKPFYLERTNSICMPMQFDAHEIHIWTSDLNLTPALMEELLATLSTDEVERANRYHFPIHRQRYIAARGFLRKILAVYLATTPTSIEFTYDEYEKPHLATKHQSRLGFNLSHSEDIAAYAFALDHAIGIDIEKVQTSFNYNVAKRFFSSHEYDALMQLPPAEQNKAFYRIWSYKEALIKAIGKGLAIPLASFSVSLTDAVENIKLEQDGSWTLLPLSLHPDYQSAVATNQKIKKISTWDFFEDAPRLNVVYNPS